MAGLATLVVAPKLPAPPPEALDLNAVYVPDIDELVVDFDREAFLSEYGPMILQAYRKVFPPFNPTAPET